MTDHDFERKDQKRFIQWCNRVEKSLPELSQRVFALRGKMYMGCGFHYSLERTLGFVIHTVTKPESKIVRDMANRIAVEVTVESLYKDLYKIEKELNSKK